MMRDRMALPGFGFIDDSFAVRCGVGGGARSARDRDPTLTRHLRAGLSLSRP